MHLSEINTRELCMLVPLGAIVVILGFYPHAVLDLLDVSLQGLNEVVLSASTSSPDAAAVALR